jgi:anti-sigma regulatory factor (Ser/Thr protein kinase)
MSDDGRYAPARHGRPRAARRHVQLTLPASGQPVRLARQVTREVLTAWQLAYVQETAVLLVSELVTNAVRHARGTDAITLKLQAARTWLRIEVYRRRPGLAVVRTAGEFDESGFGFAVVNSLADKWGVDETVVGNTAWAELCVRGEPVPRADPRR